MTTDVTVKLRMSVGSIAQVRLDDLCEVYQTRSHCCEVRREAGRQIRALMRIYPHLMDTLPEDVWDGVYRVRASGTRPPWSK